MPTKIPTAFYFDLYDDEKVLLFLRQHPATNFKWIFLTCLMLFAPLLILVALRDSPLPDAIYYFSQTLLWFWYLLTLGFALERFLLWYFNVYLVTDKRVIDVDVSNFLQRKISETPLSNIQDVTFESAGLMGTLLNIGHVYIQTAAVTREFDFHLVGNPDRVHDIITDQLRLQRHHGHL